MTLVSKSVRRLCHKFYIVRDRDVWACCRNPRTFRPVTDAPLNMYPQIKCNAFWIEKIHVSPDFYVMLPLCRSLVKTRYGFYLPHNVQCLLFSRNGNQLINLGTMSSKLAVHATSDVFRQTKETMKTAQEEWTKVRWVGVYKHALDLHGHI